jgi:hypothetical protein
VGTAPVLDPTSSVNPNVEPLLSDEEAQSGGDGVATGGGVECRRRFAGFIVETRAYENGKRIR